MYIKNDYNCNQNHQRKKNQDLLYSINQYETICKPGLTKVISFTNDVVSETEKTTYIKHDNSKVLLLN